MTLHSAIWRIYPVSVPMGFAKFNKFQNNKITMEVVGLNPENVCQSVHVSDGFPKQI